MKNILALASLGFLAACSTLAPSVPTNYQGPIAELADTSRSESTGKGVFFVATEINGQPIDNALRRSRIASNGQGFALTVLSFSRPVPTVSMKIKLVGTHQTAAPVHEIAARLAGTFFSVEGITDFSPAAGIDYVVTGELQKDNSCVWIAEAKSQAPASQKICGK